MAGYNGSVSSSTYHHNDMYDINGYGIVVRGGNSNDKIYNNDFVRCRVGGVYVCAEGSSTAGSATVKNNAFVVIADANPESGGGTPPLKVQSGSTMTADYNLYAYTGGLDGIAIASHDVICGYNDVFTDWLHNDYSVPPGSYALDAGTAISGITDGYYGSAPDIGANEGKCTLTLHVYQESSLVPIMNKQIQFKQGSTVKGTATTDSNGKCTIDLAYGTYTVKVNDSNCVWQAYDSIDLDAVTKGTYDSPVNLPVYVRSDAATTFYVAADSDTHGNDYNSGLSRTSCWRTINNGEAKGIVRSGDTVVIMSGTHAVTGTGANLSHSGIIYKGESGTLVRNSTTVAGASTTTTSCFRVTAANVTIKDMEITGGVFGVEGASGSNGLTVENCTIHDTDYRDNWPCAAGVIVSAANAGITVKNNEIYNIGSGGKTGGAIARWTSGSATQSKYIGNYIHNITGNGFLFAYGSANDLVYQNTVVTASGQGVGALGSTSDGATCTVKNNIFSGCSGGAFLAQAGCALTNSDNLVYNCGTSSGVTFGSNTIEADPLFGTAPALTALSPAVDSGANIGTTYWTPVGAGYDMGCREYAGTPNCVITGTITSDFASASPVSDATVTIGTVSATTDSNGTYSITVPRGNTYTFTVTADGYADYTGTSFAVGASDAALVKDAEMQAVCRIYGTVRSNSAVGGGVIPGATVSTTSGGSTYSTTTGADGTYSMVVPRHSQTVTITASATGYRSASATSQPIWDAEKERNFNYMQAICTVSGTVTSSFDGRAVSGAAVTVGGESTTTAADGTYSVTVD
ncbi:MAG: carboxypeptidase regulatory-like domain-containing protein, partial [Abditibacteriota bacterium]|nr:carboxypeptidase regulatory-like domain-containing protein [Abditibacteriota bacterium]